jgi:hypothetical protein
MSEDILFFRYVIWHGEQQVEAGGSVTAFSEDEARDCLLKFYPDLPRDELRVELELDPDILHFEVRYGRHLGSAVISAYSLEEARDRVKVMAAKRGISMDEAVIEQI